MFEPNEKVVCIDDAFPQYIHNLYWELPVKGQVYTVRECELGREQWKTNQQKGWESATMKVLLVELHNPDDPSTASKHDEPGGCPSELGFQARRFRPVDTLSDKEKNKASKPELIPV